MNLYDLAKRAPRASLGPLSDSPRAGVEQSWTGAVMVPIAELDFIRARALPNMRRGMTGEERMASLRKLRALPPIEIGVAPDGRIRLMDGNHRLLVARERGDREIAVQFLIYARSDDRFVAPPAGRGRTGGAVVKTERAELLVPTFRIAKLTRALERLARIAKKTGLPFRYSIGTTTEPMKMVFDFVHPESKRVDEKVRLVPAVRVVVEGVMTPTFAGWTLIARLVPVESGPNKGQNIVFSTLGADAAKYPARYRTAVGLCEHCKLSRRRNETFLLESEKHEFKSVGRECLADFLAVESADLLLEVAGLRQEIVEATREMAGDSEGGYGARPSYFERDEVINAAAWASLMHGFSSTRVEEGMSTKDRVLGILIGDPLSLREYRRATVEELARARAFGRDAMTWIASVDPGDSEYLRNLKLAVSQNQVDAKVLGIVVSLITAYQNQIARDAAKKAAETSVALGSQIVVPVKLLSVVRASGYMPGTIEYVHRFMGEDGRAYVWSTGSVDSTSKIGETMTILGTVKRVAPSRTEKNTVEVTIVRVVINPEKLPTPKKPPANPRTEEQKQAAADKRRSKVDAQIVDWLREGVRIVARDGLVYVSGGSGETWEPRVQVEANNARGGYQTHFGSIEAADAHGISPNALDRLLKIGESGKWDSAWVARSDKAMAKAVYEWIRREATKGVPSGMVRPFFIRDTVRLAVTVAR